MPHLRTPVGPNDHSDGPADAPVTLVEYGDFQCPTCGEAEPILREVRQRMGGRLRFVFREFPLTDIHPHALDAAIAAEFAAGHGQFWPLHDTLLDHQQALTRADLEGYVGELGLDPAALRRAFEDPASVDPIRKAEEDGVRSGVQGTPTLFLNGQRYEGDFDADSIIAAAGA